VAGPADGAGADCAVGDDWPATADDCVAIGAVAVETALGADWADGVVDCTLGIVGNGAVVDATSGAIATVVTVATGGVC
jgi:hypothetical protein